MVIMKSVPCRIRYKEQLYLSALSKQAFSRRVNFNVHRQNQQSVQVQTVLSVGDKS